MSKRDLIDNLKDRIRAGGAAYYYDEPEATDLTIVDADADGLLRVSEQLDLHDYSDSRHEKILRHCTHQGERVGGLVDATEDREAAEKIVAWINRYYDNPRTRCDHRLALRAFGKHYLRLGPRGDLPDCMDWISGNTPRNYKPRPSRADMLDWQDDVLELINAGTDNTRNKALFATQFEGGFRPWCELYELRVGDVKEGDYGTEIEVDGKTGQRSVTMILAVPYLNRYLGETHPRPGDDDCYLWVKSNGERMSYTTFMRYFKRAAKRAGVTKPVTPKNFRKSNATWFARLKKNQSFIEDRQGRERGSDAIAHYVAMYGDDASIEYAEMMGKDVETENPQEYAPIECPKCNRVTPRDKPICMWCNHAIDVDAPEKIEKAESVITQLALRAVKDDPSIIDEAQERRVVVELLMENDDVFEEARDLIDDMDVDL